MDILLYLTELLQTRKTVGIVGLGTLYKKKSPGKYDAQQHSFVPPSYSLAFTSEIKEDEELASYISQKRNITTDAANYFIGEFAERIQAELADNNEANLAPLGKLQSINGEITLVADEAQNVGFEFYGLPVVAETTEDTLKSEPFTTPKEDNLLEEIEEENKLEEENPGQETEEDIEENVLLNDEQEVYDEISELQPQEKTYHHLNDLPPVIETVEDQEIEAVEERQPEIISTPSVSNTQGDEQFYKSTTPSSTYVEEEEEPKKGMPFFMKFLIALLIIVALGAIVYFVNPQFFNNYFNKNFGGKQDQVVSTIPNDSLVNQPDTNKADSIAKNNDLVKLNVDTVAKPKVDSSSVLTYEVLVSAVATDKKANKIIANLAKEGVKAKKIKLSKTMINISAGTFLTEYAAKVYRDSLRIALKNQGIYIQPIKPKK